MDRSLRELVIVLGIVTLVCVVILVCLNIFLPIDNASFGLELSKSLLQIIVVFVIGTIVSALVNNHNNNRKREESFDELRKSVLLKLHRSYADAKKSRRVMRAKAFRPAFYDESNQAARVDLEVYDEQMELINETQLELEIIAKDVETNSYAFSDPGKVVENIRSMEQVLNLVVKEWERKRGGFDQPPLITALPQLLSYVQSDKLDKESYFRVKFVLNYYQALTLVRQDIVVTPLIDYTIINRAFNDQKKRLEEQVKKLKNIV